MGEFNRRWAGMIAGAVAMATLNSGVAVAQERPLVIAHRGGALSMPENTLPAFDFSVRIGSEMLEFDTLLTKDNKLVVSHDTRVNPAFCVPKRGSRVVPRAVREMTLAELRQFDCGSKRRDIYPTQKIVPGAGMPTLDEVLKRYKRAKVQFFGEIKMPKEGEGTVDPVQVTKLVEATVRRYGLVDRFILQSFDWRTIDAMHAINPRIRTCLLGIHRANMDYLALARKHNARCLVIRRQDAERTQIRALKKEGIMVISDVIDDEKGWRESIDKEVDALFTNDPEKAIAFLDGLKLKKKR